MPVKAYSRPLTGAEFRRLLDKIIAEEQAALVAAMEEGLIYGTGPFSIAAHGFHGQPLLQFNAFQSPLHQGMN